MKQLLTFIACLLVVQSFAQVNYIMDVDDTLKLKHATGGVFDSIDVSFSPQSSTLPGGTFLTTENILPYDLFLSNYGGARFRNFGEWKKMRFSALPHLGFGYVFGTQATQIVKTSYTHAFNQRNLLNVDYNLLKGSGYLRSNNYEHHDVQLQYQHTGKLYSLHLKGQYIHRKINQNDGVSTDTLIPFYGLSFAPVRKEDAASKYKGGRIELNHFFDFLMKDSINSFGLNMTNQLSVFNRRYREKSDSLAALYPFNYISSDSTNDQYQESSLSNSAGVFYARKELFVQAGLQNNWWSYSNLGNHITQSEINLDAALRASIKGVRIENHSNINFIGAKGEWFSNTTIKYAFKDFVFSSKANFSNLLPEPFQRTYFGNNTYYDYSYSDLKKQFRMDIDVRFNYTKRQHLIGVFAKNATMTSNYWWNNDQWSSDTLKSINALTVGLTGKTGYKVLRFDLTGSYSISEWMPALLVQSRLYVQGKLFKSKKLLAQIGVEASYHTAYKSLNHLPLLDIFTMSNLTAEAQANLHLFGAFEIQRFRFFFRAENFGYFWNNRTNIIANKFPIPAMQIRVGITWDFFN